MKTGPRPTPTILKVLRGNPGQRRLNALEPKPPPLEPACPEELTDPAARTEWTRVVEPAIARGQVTSDDRVLAIAHCELWATYRSQLADAAKHAHVIAVGKDHRPVANPARVMANKTLLLLIRVDEQLGFSPSARTRIKLDPTQPATSKWALG